MRCINPTKQSNEVKKIRTTPKREVFTMKMFLLATLHLCCSFGISMGAILNREISETNNSEIKDVVENGIEDIAQLIPYAVSDIQQKKYSALNDEHLLGNVKKDIDLSSFKFEKNNENTFDTPSETVADSSNNDNASLSCNWSENSFKCCQPVVPIGTACFVAEVLYGDIKLSYQIGDETVWKKTVSYKSNIETMIREVSKLIPPNAVFDENTDFESINQGNIFEHSVILTEEEEEEEEEEGDETKTAVGDDRSIATVKGKACSWSGQLGQCCKRVKILGKSYNICFQVKVESPTKMKLSFLVNEHVRWSGDVGTEKTSFNECIKILKLKTCFQFYDLRISKSGFQVCLRVSKLFGKRVEIKLTCIHRKFSLDEMLTTAKRPYSFRVDKRQDDTLPSSDDNVLRFEQ